MTSANHNQAPDRFSARLGRALFRFELGYVNRMEPAESSRDYCPFHHHFSAEIVYHQRGRGVTRLDNGRKTFFEEGSVIIYPPGMVHDQATELPLTDIVVHVEPLSPDALDPHHCLYAPPPLDSATVALLQELGDTPSRAPAAMEVGLSLKASTLMHSLLERAARAGVSEAGVDSPEALAVRAHDHIRLHYRSVRRVCDVAARLEVDYHRLRRTFRQAYGYTMKEWLRTVRLEQAKSLLRNTILPQTVIAELCGYADQQYFCSDFRKQAGLTPGRFRKQGG